MRKQKSEPDRMDPQEAEDFRADIEAAKVIIKSTIKIV